MCINYRKTHPWVLKITSYIKEKVRSRGEKKRTKQKGKTRKWLHLGNKQVTTSFMQKLYRSVANKANKVSKCKQQKQRTF